MNRIVRIAMAHRLTSAAVLAGAVAYVIGTAWLPDPARAIVAWDVFGIVFLILITAVMVGAAPAQMPANASAQEEGEWTIFAVVLTGTVVSFAAIVKEFSGTKDSNPATVHQHVALVVTTLIVSWLVTQVAFAMRYAHEYYTPSNGVAPDKGLDFPGDEEPDYWDFTYFAIVLGMTFQVSDVQITSRKLRRLATVHGLLGFLFNTVIVALTVNLAANLL